MSATAYLEFCLRTATAPRFLRVFVRLLLVPGEVETETEKSLVDVLVDRVNSPSKVNSNLDFPTTTYI